MRPRHVPFPSTMRRIALAAVIAASLAGCLGGGSCDLPTRVEVTLSSNALEPADPAVCRDQTVTLVVTSQVDGVIHIHGYDEQVPATTVNAGEITQLEFPSSRSGQFPIELHTGEESAGRAVGIFTVHEP